MKTDVLLGLQWGDEGKGKVVDFLANQYHVVARFQGGPNAGHTIIFDGNKHVLHQIPSGIFRPDIDNVIGNGVVLDPITFKKEIQKLLEADIQPWENLYISCRAQLILPTHRALDKALETQKGDAKIGSTLKGIGPTYGDKIGRTGLRIGDILEPDFQQKYDHLKASHMKALQEIGFDGGIEDEAEFFDAIEYIKKFTITESEYVLNEAAQSDKRILAEGAQGSLLDVDFGSYPFVTSSNTTVSGACAGLGLAPSQIGEVFGIFKAYCTRVGSGPFPTELFDESGETLRKNGAEFGATTGRPRRCGWLDVPALKYAIMLNGVTKLFMMKADVLSGFETIKVCTGYKLPNGEVTEKVPFDLSTVEPVYEELPGWSAVLDDMTSESQLPDTLMQYVEYLEEKLGVSITVVSVGPDRKQTIMREEIFA